MTRGRSFVALALFLGAGCGADDSADEPRASAAPALFTDATLELGLPVELGRAAPDDYFMPDVMGGGCALLDYDADGDLDAYVVAGARDGRGDNRLFRQEADGRFTDVTEAAGAGNRGYGVGVAVGDVDDDGFPDLFLANDGPDRLLRNQGDGRFEDVTEHAGIAGEGWSTSCGFFDYDRDGRLDLFVVRYVALDPEVVDRDASGKPEYPAPAAFPGLSDLLYRNLGGLAFEDVSAAAGIAGTPGRGLGLAFSDLDGDGREDVYVANDGEPNFAWLQTAPGRFEESATPLGIAVNAFGAVEASMGVACADLDGDGDEDLFLTHLDDQTNTFYQRVRDGLFRDATVASGLGAPSRGYTGFGTAALDLELDGDLDLAAVNGHVLRRPPPPNAALDPHWAPYAQPNQLFENVGAGRFEPVREGCGALCDEVEVGRGLAAGDVDGDGDLDLLVTNANGTLRLYRNDAPRRGGWLLVRAYDPERKRDALGAVVELVTPAGTQRRRVHAAGSYLSSHDPRAHFGLGAAETVTELRVTWPDGRTETFAAVAPNRAVTLVRGEGR